MSAIAAARDPLSGGALDAGTITIRGRLEPQLLRVSKPCYPASAIEQSAKTAVKLIPSSGFTHAAAAGLKVSVQDLLLLKEARKSHWWNLAFYPLLRRILTGSGLPG